MARDVFAKTIDLMGGGREGVEIDNFPDECVWCGNKGTPNYVTGHSLGRQWDYDEVIEAVFQCPTNECKRFYLAYYEKPNRMGDMFFLRGLRAPHYWKPVEFSEEINKISPSFQLIYNQAYVAEGMGLDQVCGGGYRKALEFLIKDYLISVELSKREQIKKLWLDKAIEQINDSRVQNCAKRAAWLGNDELHYERKWEEKDIQNLKELIKLTSFWIEAEVISNKYTKDMPGGKK